MIKQKDILGYVPKYNLDLGYLKYIDWYKILGKFRKTLVRKIFIQKDHWLSAALNKNTFKLSNFSDINEKSLLKSFNDIRKEYLNDDLFIL